MSKENKKTFTREDAIKEIASGSDLAKLRGVNSATIDFIYAFATLNYKNEKYDDAIIGFRFLCRHKHRDPDMWLALARTLFANGERTEALKAYLMVAILRPTAAVCLEIARAFFVDGEKGSAKVFLDAAKRSVLPDTSSELEKDILNFEKEVATL